MNKYVLSEFQIEEDWIKEIQSHLYQYFLSKYRQPIIIPLEKITSIVQTFYEKQTKPIGDIFNRYRIPIIRKDKDQLISKTIEFIISNIENEMIMMQTNKNLSIWDSLYGSFNKYGLMPHSSIKIRKNRPSSFQFHMRY